MLKLVTAATALPLTLAEIKNQLKLDAATTTDDALVMALLRSAVAACEEMTGRALLTQTWRLFLDNWPNTRGREEWWNGVRDGAVTMLDRVGRAIEIPRPPLISITHLKTYDDADSGTEFAAANYYADSHSEPGRLVLRNNQVWPATILRTANGIEVQFVAGYGATQNDVPHAIRQGLLEWITFAYEHRGEGLGPDGKTLGEIPASALRHWLPYRINRI